MRSFDNARKGDGWKRIVAKFTPEILLFIYILTFLLFRQPTEKWDRIINSDGKGYYAYLPALFIYHDLSFRFVDYYEGKYYPENRMAFKEFRVSSDGKIVNKCFPGIAFLLLPFFLIAHFLSIIAGSPADGYALLYQYSVAAAALFYFWLSCRILMKLLRQLGASPTLSAFVTTLIALGTNLMFFTLIEGSMSHVYSFFLITSFIFVIIRLFSSGKSSWIIPGMVIYSLIVLSRPTNGLVIMFAPALARINPDFKLSGIIRTPRFSRDLITGLIIATILLFLPMLMWYHQTGKWIVYSYGHESFDLTNPHFFSILFSYNRGWFTYTPLALLAFTGFFYLWKRNKRAFYWFFAFLIIYIYILSSWWIWFYASKCGQRVFIDIYALIAILLFYFLSGPKQKRTRWLVIGITVLLMLINLFQFYQHARFIFPAQNITKQIFLDSFFRIHPQAKVYLPGATILGRRSFSMDMEGDHGYANNLTLTSEHAYSGKNSSILNEDHIYSAGFILNPDTVFSTPNRILMVSAMIYSMAGKPASPLIVDFQSDKKSISYNPFYFQPFVRAKQWTKIEFAVYVPDDLPKNAEVKIYFFHDKKTGELFLDDLRVDCLSLRNDFESRHIEGISLPCR